MARKSTSSSTKISTTGPINIFLKPVTINFKELFKAAAKGVGHTVALEWTKLAADTIEAIGSLESADRARRDEIPLVQRALVGSLFGLLYDSSTLISPDPERPEDEVIESISSILVDEPIVLDEQFLDRPLNIRLVSQTQSILQAWLEAHSSVGNSGQVIAQRFPSYFAYALNNEWRKNEKRYLPLKTALVTPFTKASDQ